ncbi:hypothetical protein AA313_de0207034 [Arthrobotrys entomopaga]|nr:hypothetical protein AA313_de0207034 [Arthrobotrys entomopaga]
MQKGTSLALTTTGGQSPAPKWNERARSTTSNVGSFQIRADDSFTVNNDNHIFIGLGARDPFDSERIVPATTVAVEPNTNYDFYPHVKYFLATGSYKAGEIVDIVAVGSTCVVDFDKTPGIHVRNVTLTARNQWVFA